MSASEILKRKQDHLRISVTKNVQCHIDAGFKDVSFVHKALPEVDYDEVNTSVNLFGHEFKAPLIIEGMTGGFEAAKKVNANLAEAGEHFGIGLGVGSQRIAIKDPKVIDTFRLARDKAPNSFLIANIGILQLAENGAKVAERVVEMIDADALAIHLNVVQELVQAKGGRKFKGMADCLKEVVDNLKVPIIIKETGAGISAEVAVKLAELGIKIIDVSGAGGTSMAAIEYYRAKEQRDSFREALGLDFWDWGIPTVASIVEVRESVSNAIIIASGGVRSGIDVAKSIALGADMAGIGHPLLKPALKGREEVIKKLGYVIEQLKLTMLLTGCRSIDELKRVPVIITGRIAEWLRMRGFNLNKFGQRR